MKQVPQIRIFLASPGDVNEERAIALEVMDRLEYDPLFKRGNAGGVSIHAVAWDKPGSGTPMRVTMTPQTAIKQGLPRPSECDITIVLFWGRMGTPLPHPEYQKTDGSAYLSGTEWEFWDAVAAERAQGKPITLLYRRTEEPPIDRKDRKALSQYHAVLDFFDQFRDPQSGALKGGINEYHTPENFRRDLTDHLRVIIDSILVDRGSNPTDVISTSATPTQPVVAAPALWVGSPFPGLRAFEEKDAPIFFGRGQETSELIRRVETNRFVGVVAASGSGKSSLVAAGLIPRLRAGAIITPETNSKHWRVVRFTPGMNADEGPMAALFSALCAAFPEHSVSPFMMPQEKKALIEALSTDPKALIEICAGLLREANAPEWAELLFFVDQFEELFTVVRPHDQKILIALLAVMQQAKNMRCMITMRSDFYANCVEIPALATLFKDATYPLAAPTAGALLEMIKRPAERAGLAWEDGLPEKIQADMGSGAGALALMAYALDEMYNASQARGDHALTGTAYAAIGGVSGAIGKRAEAVFGKLALPDKELLLQRVFRELVVVDERGTATRQRAALATFNSDELALIHVLADARLLVTDEDTVEVAHEAVFRSWERLENWIAEAQEDLILLRQVKIAATEWANKGQPDFLRWPAERLQPVYAMIQRHVPTLTTLEQDFIEPEQERLLRELDRPETNHERRRDIGDRLAVIGDTRPGVGIKDGVPDIVWLRVAGGGDIEIEGTKFTIAPFFIAKYQVTYAQYQAFVAAEDGFSDDRWWAEMPIGYQKQALEHQRTKTVNSPRDNISWYQSVAFSRWLNHSLHGLELIHNPSEMKWTIGATAEVRLPTEWEWQWAAQGGIETRAYPWGNWQEGYANTSEAGLSRTTSVGMYPQSFSVCGALDMAGNLFDWCQNEYTDPSISNRYSNFEPKVLRGGSFDSDQAKSACLTRYFNPPLYRNPDFGFRLVVAPISIPNL